MVDLDQEIIYAKSFQNLLHDSQYFCIRNHSVIFASDVKIALIELSEPALGDSWLVSSVDFPDVEPFDFLNVGVVGHETGERNSQIIS